MNNLDNITSKLITNSKLLKKRQLTLPKLKINIKNHSEQKILSPVGKSPIIIIKKSGINLDPIIIPELKRQISSEDTTKKYDHNATLIIKIKNSNIFLGELQHSKDKEFLKKNNITSIACIMEDKPFLLDDEFSKDFNFLHLCLKDSLGEKIDKYFDEFIQFINTQIDENRSILVHCHMGISRSATMMIMYLMKEHNYNLEEAHNFIKSKRPQIDPNFGFYCILNSLNIELYGNKN